MKAIIKRFSPDCQPVISKANYAKHVGWIARWPGFQQSRSYKISDQLSDAIISDTLAVEDLVLRRNDQAGPRWARTPMCNGTFSGTWSRACRRLQ